MDIWEAAGEGDLERVRALIEQEVVSVQAQDAWRRTPLSRAARGGHVEVVRYLLDAGADINHRNPHGRTALVLACAYGRAEVVSVLVQRNADVTVVTANGLTALVLAASRGHDAVVRALLRHGGSDVDAVTNYGETALYRAWFGGYAGVVTQLLDAGADPTLRAAGGLTTYASVAHRDRHPCIRVLQEWHRAYTLYRARSVRDASLVARQLQRPCGRSANVLGGPSHIKSDHADGTC